MYVEYMVIRINLRRIIYLQLWYIAINGIQKPIGRATSRSSSIKGKIISGVSSGVDLSLTKIYGMIFKMNQDETSYLSMDDLVDFHLH